MTPVVLDGILYSCIALFAFMQSYFSSEDVTKYVTLQALFWIKLVVGSGAAVTGALKMYRSTTYANHVADQNGNGHVESSVPKTLSVVSQPQPQSTEQEKKAL